MDTAITTLMSGGWGRWEASAGTLLSTGKDSSAAPELRRVLNALRLQPRPARLRRQLRAVLRPVQEELSRQGWSPDAAAAACAQWAAALLVLGLAKTAIGIERERPVLFLVLLCSLLALYCVAAALSKPRCTREGRAVLKRAHATRGRATRAPSGGSTPGSRPAGNCRTVWQCFCRRSPVTRGRRFRHQRLQRQRGWRRGGRRLQRLWRRRGTSASSMGKPCKPQPLGGIHLAALSP
jgi:uncharacterized protein (TIGR04222 family)